MADYEVWDVFTDRPFGGNPLAVVFGAETLPEDRLQAIAREFNFSETTFVYPPDTADQAARVRIFTPTMEVPFAGHPTIGTALALAASGAGPDMVLGLGIGPIPCRTGPDGAEFDTAAPLERFGTPDAATIAATLGLAPAAIRTDRHPPVQAGVGLPFCLVELADRAALSACAPDTAAFRAAAARYPCPLDFAVLAYVRDGTTVHARMFAPLDNIPEDPATGSAAAALTALLAETEDGPLSLTIHQGEDMGRPSLIRARSDGRGRVTIGGQAVPVMRGTLLA